MGKGSSIMTEWLSTKFMRKESGLKKLLTKCLWCDIMEIWGDVWGW